MATELSRREATRAWRKETTKNKIMDVELAEAFAEILDEVWSKPWLGNATTDELLTEIRVRIEMDGKLQYRAIDGFASSTTYFRTTKRKKKAEILTKSNQYTKEE